MSGEYYNHHISQTEPWLEMTDIGTNLNVAGTYEMVLFLIDRTLTVILEMLKPLNINCSYAFLELIKSNLFLSSQESHEDDIQ